MRVPSIDPRHRQAAAEGHKLEADFFAAHLDRLHHVRRSLPHEFAGWGPKSHEDKPIVISWREGQNISRVPMRGRPGNVPDHELFLSLLVAHLKTTGFGNISPSVHLQLAKAAGLVDERIGVPK